MKYLPIILVLAATLLFTEEANAEGRKPSTEMTKQALEMTSGQWIAFRNYDGQQWIYFTQLVSWKCGLNLIRYSINNERLDQEFPLPVCNPQAPFASDPETDQLYLRLPLGTAKTVAVQVVYGDGTESRVVTLRPCDVPDETTCATPVKRTEEN